MAEDWFVARRWRVGGQVGRTLYAGHGDGEKDPRLLFGLAGTPEIAEHIVAGQRVVVTPAHGAPDGTGVVVAEGTLLAFGDGGQTVLEDEMGFVHYCWPMPGIKPAHNDGEARP